MDVLRSVSAGDVSLCCNALCFPLSFMTVFCCLPVCLFACLPVCLFACLPVCLFACLPVCLSACLPVCLSACLLVCLSLYHHSICPDSSWLPATIPSAADKSQEGTCANSMREPVLMMRFSMRLKIHQERRHSFLFLWLRLTQKRGF